MFILHHFFSLTMYMRVKTFQENIVVWWIKAWDSNGILRTRRSTGLDYLRVARLSCYQVIVVWANNNNTTKKWKCFRTLSLSWENVGSRWSIWEETWLFGRISRSKFSRSEASSEGVRKSKQVCNVGIWDDFPSCAHIFQYWNFFFCDLIWFTTRIYSV